MHNAVSHKLGIFKGGNHGKDPFLLAEFKVGLESHEVVKGALAVFLSQLNGGPGSVTRSRIAKPHRL